MLAICDMCGEERNCEVMLFPVGGFSPRLMQGAVCYECCHCELCKNKLEWVEVENHIEERNCNCPQGTWGE